MVVLSYRRRQPPYYFQRRFLRHVFFLVVFTVFTILSFLHAVRFYCRYTAATLHGNFSSAEQSHFLCRPKTHTALTNHLDQNILQDDPQKRWYNMTAGEKIATFKFLVEPKTRTCHEIFSNNESTVDTLAFILSSAYRAYRRNVLRQSWAGVQHRNTTKLLALFFIALPETYDEMSGSQQKQLLLQMTAESAEHNDVILTNFIDSYRNSTYKTLAALRWLHERCLAPTQVPHRARWPRFIVRADDSVFVNVARQRALIHEQLTANIDTLRVKPNINEKAFFCDRRTGSPPIFDDENSPWFVAREEWPEDVYPTYCTGSSWTMTASLLGPLFRTANTVPYFYIEDVFTTGVLGRAVDAQYYAWNELVANDIGGCAQNSLAKEVTSGNRTTYMKLLEYEWRRTVLTNSTAEKIFAEDTEHQPPPLSDEEAAKLYVEAVICLAKKPSLVWMHLPDAGVMILTALWKNRILPLLS